MVGLICEITLLLVCNRTENSSFNLYYFFPCKCFLFTFWLLVLTLHLHKPVNTRHTCQETVLLCCSGTDSLVIITLFILSCCDILEVYAFGVIEAFMQLLMSSPLPLLGLMKPIINITKQNPSVVSEIFLNSFFLLVSYLEIIFTTLTGLILWRRSLEFILNEINYVTWYNL